jgi:hypothetical protein
VLHVPQSTPWHAAEMERSVPVRDSVTVGSWNDQTSWRATVTWPAGVAMERDRCIVATRRIKPIRATTINPTPVTTRTVMSTNVMSPMTKESTRSAPANQVLGANGPANTASTPPRPIREALEPSCARVGCSMARGAWLMAYGGSSAQDIRRAPEHGGGAIPSKRGWSTEMADGARGRNRTRDIFITSEVLYQLSYSGGGTILGRLAVPQGHRKIRPKYLVRGAYPHYAIGHAAPQKSGRPTEDGGR